MAIPSGSGTEVLKVGKIHALSSGTGTIITGVANHVYTVLSIVFTNMVGTAGLIDMSILDGGVTYMLLRKAPIAIDATFVFNDKIVLSGAANLQMNLDTSGDTDVYYTYLDQDWS